MEKLLNFYLRNLNVLNLTIVRNLKKNLGEKGYKEFVDNRNIQKKSQNMK